MYAAGRPSSGTIGTQFGGSGLIDRLFLSLSPCHKRSEKPCQCGLYDPPAVTSLQTQHGKLSLGERPGTRRAAACPSRRQPLASLGQPAAADAGLRGTGVRKNRTGHVFRTCSSLIICIIQPDKTGVQQPGSPEGKCGGSCPTNIRPQNACAAKAARGSQPSSGRTVSVSAAFYERWTFGAAFGGNGESGGPEGIASCVLL